MDCDRSCGTYCTGGSVELPGDPGAGPGPTCPDLPPISCSGSASYCGDIVPFDPDEGPGYVDYPENGETWTNQYRSFLRRDMMIVVKYATAKTACRAAEWPYGNGEPLGLIDMSEADGSIPGTSIGSQGHPDGTHERGFDIDVAYYQEGQPDNRARPICEHTVGGEDAYHCVADPVYLDPWRSAFFVAALFESPILRVVGVDGRAAPYVIDAFDRLCEEGWIDAGVCSSGLTLGYETTPGSGGWYYFHHHHMHVSRNAASKAGYPAGWTILHWRAGDSWKAGPATR
jgi:hypothetical protein